jgi:hypothetical protein
VSDFDSAIFKIRGYVFEILSHPQQGPIDVGGGVRSQPARSLGLFAIVGWIVHTLPTRAEGI